MLQPVWCGVVREKLLQSGIFNSEIVGSPGFPDFDQLFRQEEAAALLSVSPRCMENWRHRGEGPKFVRVSGRCIRYRKSDLTLFVEERLRTSTSDHGADMP